MFDRLPKLLSVCGVQLSEVFNLALPYQTPLYFLHVPTMQNEIDILAFLYNYDNEGWGLSLECKVERCSHRYSGKMASFSG